MLSHRPHIVAMRYSLPITICSSFAFQCPHQLGHHGDGAHHCQQRHYRYSTIAVQIHIPLTETSRCLASHNVRRTNVSVLSSPPLAKMHEAQCVIAGCHRTRHRSQDAWLADSSKDFSYTNIKAETLFRLVIKEQRSPRIESLPNPPKSRIPWHEHTSFANSVRLLSGMED